MTREYMISDERKAALDAQLDEAPAAVDLSPFLLERANRVSRALIGTNDPTIVDELLDTLTTKDTALAEMRVELERLRHTAQSRYELLRECQTELRTLQDNPEGGLVEAIARALGPSLLDEAVKR